MKEPRSSPRPSRPHSLPWIALALLVPSLGWAGGVVTSCTETNLRTAMVGGDLVTFACDGTITLSQSLAVTQDLVLDATGHDVTISGSNMVRLFIVQPGVTLALQGLTLADAFAQGTNAVAAESPGGDQRGGAILNQGGVVEATDCTFLRNRVLGGTGGDGANGVVIPRAAGRGGSAMGGSLYNASGLIRLTNVLFLGNIAQGGRGGKPPTPAPTPGGDGGSSFGGAIYNEDGTVMAVHCTFKTNSTPPGPAGPYGGRQAASGVSAGGAIYLAGGEARFVTTGFDHQTSGGGGYRSSANGGALHQSGGSLILETCTFTSNQARGSVGIQWSWATYPGGNANGGALSLAGGNASISHSAFGDNSAIGGDQPAGPAESGSGYGGAIHSSDQLSMLNCTFAGNAAKAGTLGLPGWPAGSGFGGGLYNAGGTAVLTHVTLANNTATRSTGGYVGSGVSQGGGIWSSNGTITLQNSILANSASGSNWFGADTTLVDDGNNLSSDASCPFTAPGSLSNTNPRLAPIDDFGGPTATMALLSGSPALNAANPAWCPPTDQRGVARPYGAACDIGAFESAPPYSIRGTIGGYRTSPNGISVSAEITSTTVVTNTGRYVLMGLAPGSHTVQPAASDAVFVQSNQVVNLGPDAIDVNFTSYRSNAFTLERTMGGQVRTVLAGHAGDTWQLWHSTNLTDWLEAGAGVIGTSGLLDLTITNNPDVRARYFKAIKP